MSIMNAKKKQIRAASNTRKKKAMKSLGIILIIGASAFTIYLVLLETSPAPAFELPVHDLSAVSGVQVFHDNRSTGQVHNGFDFKLNNTTEIFAPIGGMISQINKHAMSNGYWIIDVSILINVRWSMFIAFEPWTTNESYIDLQLQHIDVKFGDQVTVNQSIGWLVPVPGAEFPHVHWNVQEQGLNTFVDSNRSPYDYCTPAAQARMYALCRLFGKFPSDA
jgi:murein DD-endopeptidase MepM/ murein hydrolase activator NlpD